ncbi:YopX family protein [Planococcus wigleyi]|uniref:YopX protein domain-containing protein n=1 Tax=Planococcus wigleyi TaxID=2762216 RepID=A0ABR8WA02_9BACL|nr:YopX family protein [Planococcus wigleyi]MBD8013862.1 hypothetical protein [Planococcus wigleyi]
MREIKFNFYNTHTKQYTRWEESNAGMNMCSFQTHEHLKFLQYTGLEDEDGTEIFEGDIIDFGGGPYKVVYEKGCFYAWTPHDSEFLHLINHLSEVVGNAYENPEFLEEEKA